ncbi:MAG: hypothetical protein J6V28_03055 [Tidjanibacter sp.]|nr:hypothetical protein [Tidjanibacter sp.]
MKIKSELRTLALAVLLLCPLISRGQSYLEITSSGDYIYGEGVGKSVSQADNRAVALISDQLFVAVKSQIDIRRQATKTNGNNEVSTITDDLINTYSSTTLTKCSRLVLENGPETYRILRYVHKEEIDRTFEAREQKILEMIRIAEQAEKERKYDMALKHYYWAQILTNTLLYPGELQCDTPDGPSRVVLWVPIRIKSILDSLEFSFGGYASEDGTLATLHLTSGGEPVTALDYTYWDGIDWSSTVRAKDGLGAIELRANAEVRSINVRIEYAYEDEMHIDSDLRAISDFITPISYKEAYKNGISLKETKATKQSAKPTKESASHRRTSSKVNNVSREVEEKVATIGTEGGAGVVDAFELATVSDKSRYTQTVGKVVAAIQRRDYEAVRDCFTPEGYGIYSRLLKYGRARTLVREGVDATADMDVMAFAEGIYCRSIPMQFSFPGNKKFVENVVFEFDGSGKISSLQFGLERTSLEGITSKKQWSDGAKMVIINFLENYKTAFALERLDYLQSVFSEDALIITGRVVRPTTIENQINLQNRQYIEYNRQTKEEYMGNLKRNFAANEYINLRFSTLRVSKMNRGDKQIYFLEVKQDYYSSNYGDTGYLTLLFDVEDYRKPIIHVRTWQPEPDPNFGIFSPGDF